MCMSEASLELLECLIENGLEKMLRLVEHNICRRIWLLGTQGECLYPLRSKGPLLPWQNEAINEPKNEFYSLADKRLFLLRGKQEYPAWLVIDGVEAADIEPLTASLEPLVLALKYYMNSIQHAEQKLAKYQQEFVRSLSKQDSHGLEKLASMAGVQLDMQSEYRIVWLCPVALEQRFMLLLKQQLDYLAETGKLSASMPVRTEDGYILLLKSRPASAEQLTAVLEEWRNDMEAGYKISLRIGIGSVYTSPNIHRSWREARMAVFFGLTTGKEGFVQNFIDLGIFACLLTQNEQNRRRFYEQNVGILESYDREYNTELLLTMRVLLANNFNWKLSAGQLFVHVNTLRYRYDKIGQLLNQNLAVPEVRANIFAAMRIRDVMEAMGELLPSEAGGLSSVS